MQNRINNQPPLQQSAESFTAVTIVKTSRQVSELLPVLFGFLTLTQLFDGPER